MSRLLEIACRSGLHCEVCRSDEKQRKVLGFPDVCPKEDGRSNPKPVARRTSFCGKFEIHVPEELCRKCFEKDPIAKQKVYVIASEKLSRSKLVSECPHRKSMVKTITRRCCGGTKTKEVQVSLCGISSREVSVAECYDCKEKLECKL